MNAVIINGKEVAAASRERTQERVASFIGRYGFSPGLATVLIGEDPASEVYVRNKRRLAEKVGLADYHRHLPATVTQEDAGAVIDDLAADEAVAGILLQLPLPEHLDSAALIERIPVEKDVDGLTTLSQGQLARRAAGLRPCTPAGVIELLDVAGVPIEGAHAVVVGRSELVGHPTAELLLSRNATVTVAHSRTRNLATVTRTAEILVAAAGIPGLISGKHIRPGATVIDVGIHRVDGGLTGDVVFEEASQIARWLTPVPGGVGPMTIARLLANTITAAENSQV